MRIFGFSLLRNGVKYDYSFTESLQSLRPLVERIHLALGKSDDGTEERIADCDFVKVLPTVWDENLRQGGLILSQQTNLALEALRNDVPDERAWGIYLQADEVIHEQDIERIRHDIGKAEDEGCDAVRFRYLHFWQSHHRIAINKKWYPQEIRAVRLRSKCESWGDAQSFRHFQKVYESDAFIYHYGHVREETSYHEKKKGFLRMYVGDQELNRYTRKMEKKDARTETLDFWGSHPRVMRGRIERLGQKFAAEPRYRIGILGDPENYRKTFIDKIRAETVIWARHPRELSGLDRRDVVRTRGSWLERALRKEIPAKMRSPLARAWPSETVLMFQLSRQGVGVDSEG